VSLLHSPRRLLATALAAVLASFILLAGAPTPALAAGVGYVRLAHLSPDTPAVDVYLSSVSGAISQQVFKAVGYGVVSPYLALPVGGYTVAMRNQGSPPASPPVLSTRVDVVAGQAYTVAGVGRFVDLGLKVIDDDLSAPAAGKAKVRVIQASVKAPVLTVTTDDGSVVADHANFASATGYAQVKAGSWKLTLRPPTGAATSASAALAAGAVYSLIVLDGKDGLTSVLRPDAVSGAVTPVGGVPTGAGGTAPGRFPWPLVAVAVLGAVLAGSGALLLRRATRARPAGTPHRVES
jgi:hypothetical protein